ncbi:type VI secretion system tube protein Hcp [Aliagarivorans marinus]|uniref:type VI secretion system tube protein Hcp n=1 Tax=Aliagarivorans marinus TaxID=561965 RepID=UPI000420874A|nr:type VI secretion system tube protein Hcp [Aliagarivorans marinus]
MDLILLQFGDDSFTKPQDPAGSGLLDPSGGSLIDGADFGDSWTALTANAGGSGFDPKKCVELVSINQGLQQQVTTDVSNSARTSGRPIISDFTCVKYVDVASPKMYDYCLRAKPLDSDSGSPTMIFVLRNSGDQLNIIMRFELRLALISEIQFQSHPNDMATEQFKLNFTEITWHHQLQGPGMQNKGTMAAGWSIAKNRPIGALTS